jgi:hypothetical protein
MGPPAAPVAGSYLLIAPKAPAPAGYRLIGVVNLEVDLGGGANETLRLKLYTTP